MPSKKPARKRGKSAAKMMEAAKKEVATAAIVKVEKKPEKPKITKAEAEERTENLAKLAHQYFALWWVIGTEVSRAVADRVPEAMGQSFTDWTQKLFGDSWQKIRRAFISYKALAHVPKEKLEKISEGNAYVLRSLPEKVRKDSDWIKSAIDLPNEKFKEKADRYLVKKTGIKDPMVKFPEAFGYSTLPKSLAKIVTSTLKLACKVNDFDWDQKEGRISATEAVFSEYFTTYQAGNQAPAKPKVSVGERPDEEIYDVENEKDFELEEEEELRDK